MNKKLDRLSFFAPTYIFEIIIDYNNECKFDFAKRHCKRSACYFVCLNFVTLCCQTIKENKIPVYF